jgi:hypothetical protein
MTWGRGKRKKLLRIPNIMSFRTRYEEKTSAAGRAVMAFRKSFLLTPRLIPRKFVRNDMGLWKKEKTSAAGRAVMAF